jgi:hypothetical protein
MPLVEANLALERVGDTEGEDMMAMREDEDQKERRQKRGPRNRQTTEKKGRAKRYV